MISQKFRVSYASGGESQPLNNTSRTLFKKTWCTYYIPLLLQKESENPSFYPMEKNIWTTILGFYQQNSAAAGSWSIYHLFSKLKSFGWQNLGCRNLRCASSSGVQWRQYLFPKVLLHRILKIFQDPRSIKRYSLKMIKEKVSSSNARDFLRNHATHSFTVTFTKDEGFDAIGEDQIWVVFFIHKKFTLPIN